MMNRVLIIGEDKSIKKTINKGLKEYGTFKLTGMTNSHEEGIEIIHNEHPEVLIADTGIGKKELFYLLEGIEDCEIQIIVLSDTRENALEYLKYQVFDYLLKPLDPSELHDSLERVQRKIDKQLRTETSIARLADQFIAIPMLSKVEFIDLENVGYCEAEGRYTIFHLLTGEKKIACKNLGLYQKILTDKPYFRVHHKYLVNLNAVQEINTKKGILCMLKNGISLPVSTRKYESLLKFLRIK